MNKCKKLGCIANLDGECAADECHGEIIQFPQCRVKDREKLKKYYKFSCEIFHDDFPTTDVREQMRNEGACEEDIELALNTIKDLRRTDNG